MIKYLNSFICNHLGWLPNLDKSQIRSYSASSNSIFTQPIPVSYIRSKDKPVSIFVELSDTTVYEDLKDRVTEVTDENSSYIVFIKMRYSDNSYLMCGKQFGHQFKNDLDFNDFYTILQYKITDAYKDYNLNSEDVNYVQITFRKVNVNLLSEFALDDKSIYNMDKPTIESIKYTLTVPFSVNEEFVGNPLTTESYNGLVTFIDFDSSNFLCKIISSSLKLPKNHKDNIREFSDNWKFYYVRMQSRQDFILAVNWKSDQCVQKIRFSLNGVVLNNITDIVDSDGMIYREEGNKQLVLDKEGKLKKSFLSCNFKPINKLSKTNSYITNQNIGVIDSETFLDVDNINKIYCLGMMSNLNKEPFVSYIQNDYDSVALVCDFIDELLRPKYNKIPVFYCHNFGGYDSFFIISSLNKWNENSEEKYIMSYVFRDDKVLKLTIKKYGHTINIVDSYSLLSSKLSDLCKDFETTSSKSYFPYRFVKRDTLYYKGDTPDIKYYESIDKNEYDSIFTTNWDLKEETLKYIKLDLISLYEVISKANRQIFNDYDVEIFDKLTISSLAVDIFLRYHYNNNIPLINKPSIYNDLKGGYYGGITEVYRPFGENLYYYDVNSLYPFVALQDMPGVECRKVHYIDDVDMTKLFGFYYCEIISPNDLYLGVLPVKHNDGIHYPVGKWYGWYFSEELKLAIEYGYKIKVIKGYEFNREKDVFKSYISKVYSYKSNATNNTQKTIAKSLLNNLLGRFGIKLDNHVTRIVSNRELNRIMCMHDISSYYILEDDKVIVSYNPKFNNHLLKQNNLDIIKLVKRYKEEEVQKINVSSISTSAAVTAYGRIHMTKLKSDIMNQGGKIYYSDTDSIITDIKLPENIVSNTELGKLKFVHKIQKAIFITGKTYCFITDDNKFICKAKGVDSTQLTYEDFVRLYNNIDVKTSKKHSRKFWSDGHVSIDTLSVVIHSNSYTKRIKTYNKDHKWVNTIPMSINNVDKYLIPYKPFEITRYTRNKPNMSRLLQGVKTLPRMLSTISTSESISSKDRVIINKIIDNINKNDLDKVKSDNIQTLQILHKNINTSNILLDKLTSIQKDVKQSKISLVYLMYFVICYVMYILSQIMMDDRETDKVPEENVDESLLLPTEIHDSMEVNAVVLKDKTLLIDENGYPNTDDHQDDMDNHKSDIEDLIKESSPIPVEDTLYSNFAKTISQIKEDFKKALTESIEQSETSSDKQLHLELFDERRNSNASSTDTSSDTSYERDLREIRTEEADWSPTEDILPLYTNDNSTPASSISSVNSSPITVVAAGDVATDHLPPLDLKDQEMSENNKTRMRIMQEIIKETKEREEAEHNGRLADDQMLQEQREREEKSKTSKSSTTNEDLGSKQWQDWMAKNFGSTSDSPVKETYSDEDIRELERRLEEIDSTLEMFDIDNSSASESTTKPVIILEKEYLEEQLDIAKNTKK